MSAAFQFAGEHRWLLVDPYWSKPHLAKIRPVSGSAEVRQEFVEAGHFGWSKLIPTTHELVGEVQVDVFIPTGTELWLIWGGIALSRIVILDAEVRSMYEPLTQTFTGIGEIYPAGQAIEQQIGDAHD